MSKLASAIKDPKIDSNTDRGRIDWVDAARGIGIALVVFGHALRGLLNSGILPPSSLTTTLDQLIYAFHMPLFFFLAGLWVERPLLQDRRAFLKNKLITVAWPYILWSIIQGTITIILSSKTQNETSINDLTWILIYPIHQFWFLYALFICQIFAAIARARIWIMSALFAASILSPSFWPIASIAALQLPYFVIGILVARRLPLPSFSNASFKVWFTVSAWALFAAIAAFSGAYVESEPALARYSLAFTGIAGTLGLALMLQRSRMLVNIGRASMAIFVLHVIISSGARIILVHFDMILDPISFLTLITVLGIFGPIAIYHGARRIRALTWMGLGTDKRSAAACIEGGAITAT